MFTSKHMGPFFNFKRRVKAVFKNKARHIQRKTHTKLIPGYLFYNAERQVREANEDKVPAAYKQTERENSCHMHAPNNITAMNNLSYCVCDPSNFSPGYILKVNLKELEGGGCLGGKFVHGHTDKCKPTWKTGQQEGQAICWEACAGRPRLIKRLLGGLSLPLSIRQKHVWLRLNSKSSVQRFTHLENWIWTFA